MNKQMIRLTEAIDRHVVQIQELKADNERLIAALRYIDDEAHDLNAEVNDDELPD